MSYAVALDPGGTTGIALVQDEERPWDIDVIQLKGQHHRSLYRFLVTACPKYVICETFENRGGWGPNAQSSSAMLESREYIGVAKLYCQSANATGVWQSASTGKAFWDNDKLESCGLYIAGLKHARDAVRHYAHWRTFTLKDHTIFRTRGRVARLTTFRLSDHPVASSPSYQQEPAQ